MSKSTSMLRASADKAAKANSGFRVISIYPVLKDGQSVAEITLVQGDSFKTVDQKLD